MTQTFKQYLLHEADANPKHVYELLQHDSAPFLRDVGGMKVVLDLYDERPTKGLIRGMKSNDPFMTKNVRESRAPVDTQKGQHEYIDNWFNSKFGHKYRSNAVFASNHPGQARAYGPLYWIFPVGQYTACWSPKVRDLYSMLVKQGADGKQMTTALEKKIDTVLTEAGYVDGKLTAKQLAPATGLDGGFEIMVACKQYHAVSRPLMEQMYLMTGGS